MTSRRAIAFALALLLAAPALAGEPVEEPVAWEDQVHFHARMGVDFSSGDYGEATVTDIWFFPATAGVEYKNVTVEVTVPYVVVDGRGTVTSVIGGGGIPTGDNAENRDTENGIGDVVASLAYAWQPPVDWAPTFEIAGSIKFPTAEKEKGIGTGEFDYTIQGDVYDTFWIFTPFATFGHTFVGKSAGLDLNDRLFASAGLGVEVLPGWLSVGGIYDWREASTDEVGDAHEVLPYASLQLGDHFSVLPYALFGLSEGAADFGGGVQVGFTY